MAPDRVVWLAKLATQIFETLTVFIEGPNRCIQARINGTKEYSVIGEIAAQLLEFCASRVFFSSKLAALKKAKCNGWATKNGRGHVVLNNPFTYSKWMLIGVKESPKNARQYAKLVSQSSFADVLTQMAFCELKILQFVTRNLEGG